MVVGLAGEAVDASAPPPGWPSAASGEQSAASNALDSTSGNGEEAQSQPDTAAAAQRARQVQVFGPVLLNPSKDIDPQTRRDAARELLEMGTPEATRILDSALRSRKASVMMAALSVLEIAPPESLIVFQEACLSAILDAPTEAMEGLGVVLARMSNGTLNQLADMAVNQNLPPESRVGPIHALGAFRNRQATGHLMSLLEGRLVQVPPPPRLMPEPTVIVDAACSSLQRLTGLAFGRDAASWRKWWNEVSGLPTDQWFRAITQSLGERVASLEASLNQANQTNDALSRQVFDTYRELYPALPVDEQLRRLPRLLEDKSPPVRMFALSRISLLLRDSVRIGPELQGKLAERLTDEVPDLRAQTLLLLDELNYEGLTGLIATRLDLEQSPTVAKVLFDLAAQRADVALLPSIRRWFGDPTAGDDAAAAAWRLIVAVGLTNAQAAQTRTELARAVQDDPTAAQWRLLAFVADASDMPALEAVLDGPDVSLRRAVAEGLSRRGMEQPLVDRAKDEAIYPFAVEAMATERPTTMEGLRALIAMEPPANGRNAWMQAVRTVADALPVSSLAAADDLLINASWAGPDIRRDVLTRCSSLSDEDAPQEVRLELIRRFADVLLTGGNATLAFECMDAACAGGVPAALADVRFRAAVMSSRFDAAAHLRAQPDAWLALLDELTQRDPSGVAALRQEIIRRFGSELTNEQRRKLEQLGRLADGHATADAKQDGRLPDS